MEAEPWKPNCSCLSVADLLHLVYDVLFGCWHRKLSRPFTLSGWTYEVCLNCGKKFAYNRADIGRHVPERKEGGVVLDSVSEASSVF